MRIESTSNHLDDGDLVRYIDQEWSADEHARWTEHVGSCPRCRAEAATLRDQSAAITAWLERADFGRAAPPRPAPAPARLDLGGARPWLKAAAIILLVAAPVVAITPARDWVADRLGLAGNGAPATTAASAGEQVDRTAPVVRFAPAPGSFTIDVTGAQDRGDLTLGRVPAGAVATFEMTGAEPWPETVVAARGLRIENDAAAAASYTVLLPPEVTAVIVTVGARRVSVSGPELDRSTVVPLGRSGDRP